MGRKRKTDKHLPQRVYQRRGVYYWFPPKKDAEILGKTAIRLGKTLPEAMRKWAELAEGTTTHNTMGGLMDRYMIEIAPKKAERTYFDNRREMKSLRAFFGTMQPQDVTRVDVYTYLDKRGAPVGTVNLTISKPHNRSTVSSLFYEAIIWAHVTFCHSQNALERNSR